MMHMRPAHIQKKIGDASRRDKKNERTRSDKSEKEGREGQAREMTSRIGRGVAHSD